MVETVRQILDGTQTDASVFADHFCQLARVTIEEIDDSIKVDIYAVKIKKATLPRSTLLLATIEVGGDIPAGPIYWHHVPLPDGRTATLDLYPPD